MSRKLKNVVMILAIFVLIGSIIFTSSYAKKNIASTTPQTIGGDNKNGGMPNGNPPDMSNEERGGNRKHRNSSSDEIDSEKMTRPERQNKSFDTTSEETNEENEPPEKLDGESENEPPEKPSDDGDMTPPEMGDSSFKENHEKPDSQMMNMDSNTTLTTKYYVIYAVLGFLISILIMYLILSKFNKRSFKETFNTKDRVIIHILSSIILTIGLTFGSSYITNNYVLKDNDQSEKEETTSKSNIDYSSAKSITESTTISDEKFESSKADENAILVSGNVKTTLSDIEVSKTGDSDGGDDTSFYGNNSAILAKDGATLTIEDATITTDADGANGVFSYGGSATTNNSKTDGTTVNISNSTITTSKGNSGGIMTTGGGTTNASNLTITTSGRSSAAIRSDRGGGTVNVDGGTYKTSGLGSPTIYSTANITVKNAELVSTTSEGAIIEGKNSITLENVKLTDTNTKNVKSTTFKNIFIYQSMSGDAANGNATFTSKDSTIVTNKGDSFYVTNTTATINLKNNTITNNDESGNFLKIGKDSWGKEGSNGGDVVLNLEEQEAEGNIVVDEISTLIMNMKSSTYKGTINSDNSAKSIKLNLDENSKIILTGDSYISSLTNSLEDNSNIDFNGYKLYVNGKVIN